MLLTFECGLWTHTLWKIFPNVLPCLCLSVSFVSCILSIKSDTIPSATPDCHTSTYGCCYDGVTAAGGTHGEGCLNTPTNSKSQHRKSDHFSFIFKLLINLKKKLYKGELKPRTLDQKFNHQTFRTHEH